jgi:hypothetical protein
MSFKTQKEIWEALISQKKVSQKTWSDQFLYLDNGFLHDEDGERYSEEFDHPADWSPYKEPKKMKPVTLYRYTYQLGLHFYRTGWSSEAFIANQATRLVKTETETIEIEDV